MKKPPVIRVTQVTLVIQATQVHKTKRRKAPISYEETCHSQTFFQATDPRRSKRWGDGDSYDGDLFFGRSFLFYESKYQK